MFKSKNDKNSNRKNFKTLEKIHNSQEYLQNQMQINCITNILVEHADVPKKLIDWLIKSVEENVTLEHNSLIKNK